MERACRELGLQAGASETDIKAAYRKLVLQFHPDRHLTSNPSEQAAAAQRFKVVTEAYDFLTNPNERARSSYGASSSSSSSSSRAYHYNVNTDWSHSYQQGSGGGGGGYTSTISRWEWWKRAARHGVRGLGHTLHLGLALVLVGGALTFELTHTALWNARNKGKLFDEMHAAVRAKRQSQQQTNSSAGDGDATGSAQQPQQQVVHHIRSSWADSMRGRLVPGGDEGPIYRPSQPAAAAAAAGAAVGGDGSSSSSS